MEQEGGVVEEFEEEFGAQENDCFLLCKVNHLLAAVLERKFPHKQD